MIVTLAAEAAIGLRHFDAGIAAAKHDQMRRHVVEFERLDMGERVRVRQARNIRHSGMRADVDHDLVAGKHARAAFVQRDIDCLRADETATAHDKFGTCLLVGIQMQLDLAIDHVLLTASHPRHVGPDPIHDRAEAGRIPNEMRHPRAPDFVLGGQTRHGRAGAADPTALHDGNPFAGPPQMPGKVLSALAAPEDDDVENFRLGHGSFRSSESRRDEPIIDGSTVARVA